MELLSPWRWFDYLGRNRLRILMYHSISDAPGDWLAVHPDLFTAEMHYLSKHRFEVVPLQHALRLLATNANLRRKIVLTFDDGYVDFMTTAAPVLKQYGFAAMLFVVTGIRDGGAYTSVWRSKRPLLSPDQTRRVKAMGFSLGSHTVTHPDLTTVDEKTLKCELQESRAALEALGETFFAFAYPGGTFSRRERSAVERAGYDCAAIVGGRWGNGAETDRFLLKREPMLASDSLRMFVRRVSGHYEPYYLWARARGIGTR
jgi:peptidoglycan/xylan/chitin deacetylase (PgdA/CDA1 family)